MVLFFFTIPSKYFPQEFINTKVLLLNGEYQKVIEQLEKKLTKNDSLSFSEYNMLGNAYSRLMSFNKAIINLKKAQKIQPENINNLVLLGSCYDASGDKNMAKVIFENVLKIEPPNKAAKINLGKILISLDEYDAAAELYKNMIITDSTNSYFYSQLGICELKNGNTEFAKECFKQSIEMNISDSKTLLMLAKLYYNDKQYDEAIYLIQEGLKQNSKNKALNKMLADVFYKNKRYPEAIIKYLYCNTIGDTSAGTYQKLGMSYYYLSFTNSYVNTDTRELKLKEGIQALKTAAAKNPKDAVNYLYLGLCYKELQEYKSAIDNLEETLNHVFPDYLAEVYYNLGGSYGNENNYIESIKAYKEALSYNPKKKIIYFYLANIYDRYYADKSVAILYYQKFVDEEVDADENLVGYSLNRINTLSKEDKFWGR